QQGHHDGGSHVAVTLVEGGGVEYHLVGLADHIPHPLFAFLGRQIFLPFAKGLHQAFHRQPAGDLARQMAPHAVRDDGGGEPSLQLSHPAVVLVNGPDAADMAAQRAFHFAHLAFPSRYWALSCPQAAAMSCPCSLRIVAFTPFLRKMRWNRKMSSRGVRT